jgi:hypothetical protein
MSINKQIEELAEEILQEYTNCYSEVDKEVLVKMICKALPKQSEVALSLLSELKKEAHNKAVHPCGCKIDPYISLNVLDGIIQKYINKYYEEGKKI